MLADLGAEVIKIEAPGGDVTRTVPPVVSDVSVYYAQLNAGKRNVCLDLKSPGAAEVIARLAGASDVVVENFRPGVLARFGLDAPTLRAGNPRLIYCSITGWGQDGPWIDRRAYAPLVHAEVGMLEMGGRVRGRRPEQEVNQHGDVYPALMATNAVLAALSAASDDGQGSASRRGHGPIAGLRQRMGGGGPSAPPSATMAPSPRGPTGTTGWATAATSPSSAIRSVCSRRGCAAWAVIRAC